MVEQTYDTTIFQEELARYLGERDGVVDSSLVEEVVRATLGVLEKALDIDVDEIIPDSTLIRDLEAESLDYLFISYGLEQTLKIPPESIFPHEVYSGLDTTGFYDLEHNYTDLGMFETKERQRAVIETMAVEDRTRFERSRNPIDLIKGQNVLGLMARTYELKKEQKSVS